MFGVRAFIIVLVATTTMLGGIGVKHDDSSLDEKQHVPDDAVQLSLLDNVQSFLENIDNVLETVVDLLETLQRLFGASGEGGD